MVVQTGARARPSFRSLPTFDLGKGQVVYDTEELRHPTGRDGQLGEAWCAARVTEGVENRLGGADPTGTVERHRQPEQLPVEIGHAQRVIASIGIDHPDAQCGREVSFRAEIAVSPEREG